MSLRGGEADAAIQLPRPLPVPDLLSHPRGPVHICPQNSCPQNSQNSHADALPSREYTLKLLMDDEPSLTCPNCTQNVRLSSGREGPASCPNCGTSFRTDTNSDRVTTPDVNADLTGPPSSRGVIGYLRAHWRGELSLAVSYWVNGVLISVLFVGLVALTAPALEQFYASVYVRTTLGITLVIILLGCAGGIWQWVGIWRAASASVRRTGKRFWPGLAKFMVVIGVLGAVRDIPVMTGDIVRMYRALSDPDLADYEVTVLSDTDLIFSGAINDQSVDETISALEDSDVTILRIESHGGLATPALRLARYIERNDVFVMAEGECASGCVIVLAASPEAAIYPGTVVSFHDPEIIAEIKSPDLRPSDDDLRSDVEEYFRSRGIKEWALTETRRKGYWSPSINQQVEMGLLKFIYDPDKEQFEFAQDYCSEHPKECE